MKFLQMYVIQLFFLSGSFAQTMFLGKCPDHPVVEDLKPGQLAGKWYEVERSFVLGELGGKCPMVEYTDFGYGKFGFLHSQIKESTETEEIHSGIAELPFDKSLGKFIITLSSLPLSPIIPIRILKTDYKNFALIWSCINVLGILNFQSIWVLARERDPPSLVYEKVYKHLSYLGINTDLLDPTDQYNCT